MNTGRWTIVVAVIGAGVAVFTWPPNPIRFGNLSAGQFTQQLWPLFVVALLIERSLEVFITTWRGAGEATRQRSVAKATANITAGTGTLADLHNAKDELTNYKSATQQRAMPIALIVGILVSALGVRCLGNIVAPDGFQGHPIQQAWFTVADVLLTGALLGGGSDFVHQFITSITDFMSQSKS